MVIVMERMKRLAVKVKMMKRRRRKVVGKRSELKAKAVSLEELLALPFLLHRYRYPAAAGS